MQRVSRVSNQTRNNWMIDAALAVGALVAALTGVYFLYLPVGGFQGGRNPLYDFNLFFDRHTWDLLHTWSGVVMIAAAVIHFSIHYKWVAGMARRIWHEVSGRGSVLNPRGRFNVWLDAAVALTFLLSALSGVYYLFIPGNRSLLWDVLHTWSSVAMIILALAHFAIHWQWVVKVTRRVLAPGSGATAVVAPAPRHPVVAPEV